VEEWRGPAARPRVHRRVRRGVGCHLAGSVRENKHSNRNQNLTDLQGDRSDRRAGRFVEATSVECIFSIQYSPCQAVLQLHQEPRGGGSLRTSTRLSS
jgi:hypothetical protein